MSQRNFERYSGELRPVDVPEVRACTQFALFSQGLVDDKRASDNFGILLEGLHTQHKEYLPYCKEHKNVYGSTKSLEQTLLHHSDDRIPNKSFYDHAVYSQKTDLMTHVKCEDVFHKIGAENLDRARWEQAYGALDKCTDEDSWPDFVGGAFMETSPEYALAVLNDDIILEDTEGKAEQTQGYWQPCIVIGQRQAVDSGQPLLGDDEYGNANYSQYGRGQEADHLRPKREGFWRRHKLG